MSADPWATLDELWGGEQRPEMDQGIGGVAFYGRRSTEDTQGPETSHGWQLGNARRFVEPLAEAESRVQRLQAAIEAGVDPASLVEVSVVTGGHAGRVSMCVADADPYASPPLRTPLPAVQRWDAWRPVPFGRDARDRRIDLPLVWTSLLVGAIPRQGETFAARLAASGLIRDPHTRLYVADFKARKDWDAAAQVAHRFMSGDESVHVVELVGWLVELVAEVQGGTGGCGTWTT